MWSIAEKRLSAKLKITYFIGDWYIGSQGVHIVGVLKYIKLCSVVP
jgi:hypothetical protein